MENHLITTDIGHQLRLRREEMLLTHEEVATRLFLGKDVIKNIEQGNYHHIPYTYLKGYLRAYAKLLAFPDLEFPQTLPVADNSYRNWKVFSCQKQVSAGHRFIQWITVAIITSLICLVALWWKSDYLLNKNLALNKENYLTDPAFFEIPPNYQPSSTFLSCKKEFVRIT